MAWSPVGVTVSVTVTNQILGAGSVNTFPGPGQVAYVSRVFNAGAAIGSFSLGAAGHTAKAIPLGIGQSIFVGHGPNDNFVQSSGSIQVTLGIGNITSGS